MPPNRHVRFHITAHFSTTCYLTVNPYSSSPQTTHMSMVPMRCPFPKGRRPTCRHNTQLASYRVVLFLPPSAQSVYTSTTRSRLAQHLSRPSNTCITALLHYHQPLSLSTSSPTPNTTLATTQLRRNVCPNFIQLSSYRGLSLATTSPAASPEPIRPTTAATPTYRRGAHWRPPAHDARAAPVSPATHSPHRQRPYKALRANIHAASIAATAHAAHATHFPHHTLMHSPWPPTRASRGAPPAAAALPPSAARVQPHYFDLQLREIQAAHGM